MKDYSQIEKFQKSLEKHQEKIEQLQDLLTDLDGSFDEYKDLVAYYVSPEWLDDYDNVDSEDLIERDIKSDILSQDAVYNLIQDYHLACIQMLDLTSKYLKEI